jgi:hypothetical protein
MRSQIEWGELRLLRKQPTTLSQAQQEKRNQRTPSCMWSQSRLAAIAECITVNSFAVMKFDP